MRVEDQDANTDSEDGPADTASGRDGASAEGGVRGENLQRHLLFVRAAHHRGDSVNECADPDVARDIEGALDRLIPKTGPYRHSEGNSDSHIKSVLVGGSQIVFVEDGRLALGRWQGIFFCEFDGPRERKLVVKFIAEKDDLS